MSKKRNLIIVAFICMVTVLYVSINPKLRLKYEMSQIAKELNEVVCNGDEYIKYHCWYVEQNNYIEISLDLIEYSFGTELNGMFEIAAYFNNYMESHSKSFFKDKKISLNLIYMDAIGCIQFCNYDPETDEMFSDNSRFGYGYFFGLHKTYLSELRSLSELKSFDQLEILCLTSYVVNDDYSVLLSLPELKEVRCESPLFSEEEIEELKMNGIIVTEK